MEPVTLALIGVLLAGGVILGSGAAHRNSKRHRQRILHQVAEGIPNARVEPYRWVTEPSLHYTTEHYGVDVGYKATNRAKPNEAMVIHLQINEPFPSVLVVPHRSVLSALNTSLGRQDIEIGFAPFDDDFRIQGANPNTIQRLFTADVRNLLFKMGDVLLLQGDSTRFTIELHLWMLNAADITRFIQQTVDCWSMMRRAYRDPYIQIANERSLALEDSKAPLGFKLRGQIHGVPISAIIDIESGRVSVLAQNPNPRLQTFICVHKDHKKPQDVQWGPTVPLANPVTSRMIRVHSKHAESLHQWVNQDPIYGAILPIAHGYPGSSVTDRGITLISDGLDPEAIGPAIDQVVASFQVLYLD